MRDMETQSVDLILTSPFYNTNKKQHSRQNKDLKIEEKYPYRRYDVHVDNMTNDEYSNYTVKLFDEFDRILKSNGVILYNLSYGNNNRTGMLQAINAVIDNTNFTIADIIVWKKKNAMPNNCSSNKLTRICEFIFVFCRLNEVESFHCNKPVVSIRKTGQKSYGSIFNFIEAKNNDEVCPFNRATFSTDLCKQLLTIYATDEAVVYDPFMGTGTTALACKQMGLHYIGSEISEQQCEWAENRLLACNE